MPDNNNDISIMDVTIRDGSYAVDYSFTAAQVARIAGALDRAGIDYIEVGHGCGIGAGESLGLSPAASDASQAEAARGAVKRAKIGVIAGAERITKQRDIDSVIDLVDFMRFFTSCATPRGVEANISYAKGKRPALPVFLQLTNSTRRPAAALVEAARMAEDMGVETMYIVDTASHFMPDEVFSLVSEIRSRSSMGVGFHGHDGLCLAVANTIAAARAGAASVDGSLRGIGRGSGNAQLEAVVSLMHRMGKKRSCNLDALTAAAAEHVEPIMPPRRGVSGPELAMADANISLYPVPLFLEIAKKAGVSFAALVRALGDMEAVAEVEMEDLRRALARLGAEPGEALRDFVRD
ncbi:MAG: hypothetical protein JXA24_01825 [Proteobacteria bacterium]|nr:hypothetical protein [Pseudomonadota bacterium]